MASLRRAMPKPRATAPLERMAFGWCNSWRDGLRLRSVHRSDAIHLTGCRFDKLPFDSAQGLSLSNGKALSLPKGKARCHVALRCFVS